MPDGRMLVTEREGRLRIVEVKPTARYACNTAHHGARTALEFRLIA